MARVLFINCTSLEFKNLASKDQNAVYWLSDTKQIYKGEDLYSNDVIVTNEAPTFETAEEGKIYAVKQANGSIKLYMKGETSIVSAGGEVSSQDVSSAIEAALEGYKSAIVDVSSARSEDNSGTVITFTGADGSNKNVTVADLFLTSANYNTETHELELTVQGQTEPVKVDLSELVPQAVNASQVAMARNITATVAVGNIHKGDKVDISDVQTVQDMFEKILSQDVNPTTVQPSVSISLSGAGAKEVGTEFTPAYVTTFNAGSYSATAEGAQPTGVTPTGYEVVDTNNVTKTDKDGSFDKFTVLDDTNYNVSATVTYGDGAIPKTFLGKEYAAGQIKAGTKTARSGSVTGYRNGFFGGVKTKDEINSAVIRSLSVKSNTKVAKGQQYVVTIPAGSVRDIIAFDASIGTLNDVTSKTQINSSIRGNFVQQTVEVLDASGSNGKTYNVYVYDHAALGSEDTYTITI